MRQQEYNNILDSVMIGMNSGNVEEAFAVYNMACALQEMYPKLEEARVEQSNE
tara:strand:+ start:1493 stop:1651 length:159 start_codon:yes stop_codon:yes gene_type:complete